MVKTNKQKAIEARDWVKNLKPTITNLSFDKKKKILKFKLNIDPISQVRQTQNSGRYLSAPIMYNGWKHACALVLKKAIRDEGLESNFPLKGWLRLTTNFYLTDNRKFRVCDFSNILKALEDCINTCASGVDKLYPDSTPELKVWDDDRFVQSLGPSGKYLSDVGYADVTIEVLDIDFKKEKKK